MESNHRTNTTFRNRSRHKTEKRTFYPGDEWLYFKIYTGIAGADYIVSTLLAPLISNLRRKRAISSWFFIRYSDPNFHLRIRFRLTSPSCAGTVIATLRRTLSPMITDHMISSIQIDTYSRELERYPDIDLAETLFNIDSEAICRILGCAPTPSLRWLTGIALNDSLLNAFGMDLQQKCDIVTRMSEGYKQEFGFNTHNSRPLHDRYRTHRRAVERAIEGNDLPSPVVAAISNRAEALRALIAGMRPSSPSITSYMHMTINRLLTTQARANELVIYMLMARTYQSLIARSAAIKASV